VLHECLGGMKPVIMSDRHRSLLYAVPRVFRLKNHCYCLVHLRENIVKLAGKLGIGQDATKDLVKEMFNQVAYTATSAEYGQALDELRHYKK